ncbi:hypothetical protein [Butyrivibrio sp. VCB2001]|uniref:hypothetical protein n=1 Tax=Butyrivibrio sp. VCB2001 TaxID=1280667 RepID=UPI000402A308|nr:hypothetical protein [Butyrivibrio sp. VCB2001]
MADNLERDINTLLNNHGLEFSDLVDFCFKKNSHCIQMSKDDYNKYCELYDEVFSVPTTTKDKGNKLEDLVEFLFVKALPGIFEVVRNCRTSSNEIDLLIKWTLRANTSGVSKEFCDLGNTILCECKNYIGKVDVTYIGKFISLMSCSDTKLGIMVAWYGVTGKGWNAGLGLIKKIALAEKRYILIFTREDLESIYLKRDNLYNLLSVKLQALKQDVSYNKLITKHELVDKWSYDN